MRPAGPEPWTRRSSIPASRARSRTAGEASGLSVVAPGLAVGCRRGAITAGSAIGAKVARLASSGVGADLSAVRDGFVSVDASVFASTLRRTKSEPIASTSPTLPASQTTSPSTGEGISTVALSVITAPSGASSRTRSPTFTCHSTSSASAMPSPTSGSLTVRSTILWLQRFHECAGDPLGAWKIVPLLRVRVGRIPSCDPRDRRFQMIETALLHQRAELGAKARGQRRFMHDHAAPGFLDRGFDGVEIERQQGTKIDDFGVETGFRHGALGDVNHGSVRKNGHGVALSADRGATERHRVVPVGDFAEIVLGPWRHRPVVMPVEGPVIEPLRLKKDHGIGVLDR